MISQQKRRLRRAYRPKPAPPRTFVDILRHPRTDAEQEIADQHIAVECARIRATWDETETACRAMDCNRVELLRRAGVIPTVAWLGRDREGRPTRGQSQ